MNTQAGGWVGGWMDIQMCGWVDGYIDEQMDEWMGRWIYRWMDRWMEGGTDVQINRVASPELNLYIYKQWRNDNLFNEWC